MAEKNEHFDVSSEEYIHEELHNDKKQPFNIEAFVQTNHYT